MLQIDLKQKSIQKRAIALYVFYIACTFALEIVFPDKSPLSHRLMAILMLTVSSALTFVYPILRNMLNEKYRLPANAAIIFVSAFTGAMGVNSLYCSVLILSPFGAASWVRITLFTMLLLVVNSYVLFDKNHVNELLFKYRWYIALGTFAVFVALCLNFSNVACFSYYIQPNINSEFDLPVFGTPRDIRSDEWLVDTPRRASAEYSEYGIFNFLVRGTQNYNISSSYLYLAYSALSNVFNLGYYLFGTEYGASFHWCGLFIMSIMLAYEFSLIITNHNRRISLLGCAILGLSSFSLWWSINIHIIAVEGLLVCAYYFFKEKKLSKQIPLALGVAMSAATFICQLYPAWQVPLAYILLACFVWIIIENIQNIKKLNLKQWVTVGCAFVFMCSIVIAYLYDTREYSEAVMNTVYPGSRFSTGGDSFYKGSWYIQTLMYPFKDTGNNSEAGTFFNLFPLPMLFAAIVFIVQVYKKIRYKNGTVDYFLGILLIPTAVLTVYCTNGVSEWFAKFSLLSYSIPERAIDFLCFANVLFLLRLFSYKDDERIYFPFGIGLSVSILLVLYNIKNTADRYPQYMSMAYVAVISLLVVGLSFVLLSKAKKKLRNTIITVATLAIIISGISVLPITRGFDALLDKPASYAVQDIRDDTPDSKWIGYDSIVTPQFLIANGAPTINSVNYIPNMELWTELDPSGAYNEVYNRYAHVNLVFCEEATWFELRQADLIILHLNYADISKTEVEYIYSQYPLSETVDFISFELLYEEDNAFIYKINYN